jgi:hypothetical protein
MSKLIRARSLRAERSEYYNLSDNLLSESDVPLRDAQDLNEEPETIIAKDQTNMLSIEGTGCIGRIENLPLWIKLILMSNYNNHLNFNM